jgi:signal transduction histidine kinase
MGLPDGVVRVECAPDTPDIVGDARQLNQVFNNLIKNAWEALHRHAQPRIFVSARRADDGQSAIVQVRDNGLGIPPDLLDRIWVSFFTTKGDRGGTGLGLSACAGIVGQHGGKIWVDSPLGEGATFSVLLPAG